MQRCITTWFFRQWSPQKAALQACSGYIVLKTVREEVTCPDRQYELFYFIQSEGQILVVYRQTQTQHFAEARTFCPADSAGTREGERDVQIGKIYPASMTKELLDFCWLTEVCVNIFLTSVARLQSPSAHESPVHLSGTTITMPGCCATDGI